MSSTSTIRPHSPDDDLPPLRLSRALAQAPAEREATPPPAAPNALGETSAPTGGLLPVTLTLGALAVVTSLGWLLERRRARHEQDSVLWAGVQPRASTIVDRTHTLDDILPDSPNPAEKARAIYVTAIGETSSRREATLIDLHQLQQKLERRRKRGDHVAAVLLLQQHLVDFRYTSPWVFLELREQYRRLNREKEWQISRSAFKNRFGQNAPQWTSPSTADAQLLDDPHFCEGIVDNWPYRAARMWILHWMLGEHEARQRALGPPLLPLGVYRDMLFLDDVLDLAMTAMPPVQGAQEPDTIVMGDELSPT